MNSIQVDGTHVAYSDSGTGEPVLLIHCSSASGTEWRSLTEFLGKGFRTIAPDQLGCGKSEPWVGSAAFRLADEAEPILALLDAIAEPVHLVGHSYGGGVALRVARARPEAIRSLTLVEPSIFHVLRRSGPDEQVLFRQIARVAATVREAVVTGDYWGGMGRFVDYWSGEGAWERLPHEARIKLSQRLTKVVLDFRALFEEPARVEDYAAVDVPTLILCGEHSPGPSQRIVEMLAEVMPRARIERIAGAGHMSPLTHPEPVNAAIGGHLSVNATTPAWQAQAA